MLSIKSGETKSGPRWALPKNSEPAGAWRGHWGRTSRLRLASRLGPVYRMEPRQRCVHRLLKKACYILAPRSERSTTRPLHSHVLSMACKYHTVTRTQSRLCLALAVKSAGCAGPLQCVNMALIYCWIECGKPTWGAHTSRTPSARPTTTSGREGCIAMQVTAGLRRLPAPACCGWDSLPELLACEPRSRRAATLLPCGSRRRANRRADPPLQIATDPDWNPAATCLASHATDMLRTGVGEHPPITGPASLVSPRQGASNSTRCRIAFAPPVSQSTCTIRHAGGAYAEGVVAQPSADGCVARCCELTPCTAAA